MEGVRRRAKARTPLCRRMPSHNPSPSMKPLSSTDTRAYLGRGERKGGQGAIMQKRTKLCEYMSSPHFDMFNRWIGGSAHTAAPFPHPRLTPSALLCAHICLLKLQCNPLWPHTPVAATPGQRCPAPHP
jgi:hypothetical protein